MPVVYSGNYNVLTDAAGSVIPIQLSLAQLNVAGGLILDTSSVGSSPNGPFGAIKGVTLDLQALTAGTITLTSPDLPGWQSSGAFGGFQIIRIPGQTSRLVVTGGAAAGGVAALTLWNSLPSTEIQSLANLNATVAGSVTISGIANVAITGTPSVNVANTPAVTVTGTPNVNVVNTASVNVANTPDVNIGNTGTVAITGTPNVNIASGNVGISGTPNVNIASGNVGITSLGSVDITNAYTYQQTQPAIAYVFVSSVTVPFTGNIITPAGTKGIIVQSMQLYASGFTSTAGATANVFIQDNASLTTFFQTTLWCTGGAAIPYATVFEGTNLGWGWNTGAAMTLSLHTAVTAGTFGSGLFNLSIGYYIPP